MRKPIENGLASIATPRWYSMAKVSRELWPSAITTWSARSSCDVPVDWFSTVRPRTCRPPGLVFNQHVGHALLKADLAAQRNDLLAQVLHHLDQLEGADVRVRLEQNFGGAPAWTNSFITLRPRKRGSLIWL